MTQITIEMEPEGIKYTDPHGNVIGWCRYYDDCFHFHTNRDYADHIHFRLNEVQAMSLGPIDQIAYAAYLIAEAAGY